MPRVGIIPNPASGKDIRRLVAKALVVSNQQKVNIVSSVLAGLQAAQVDEIFIMPDLFGIGAQALHGLRNRLPDLQSKAHLLDLDLTNSAYDSEQAARWMRQEGLDCIVVLGGDGTTRVVSKEAGDLPLLPISTGTNNVVPSFVEGTIAGLCSGYLASLSPEEAQKLCLRSKRIEVWVNGELADIALVDLAVSAGVFVGARAIWEPESLRQVAVTRAAPNSIGLSAIVAMLNPISLADQYGGIVAVNPPHEDFRTLSVPLGPGLVAPVNLGPIERMDFDQDYPVVSERPLVLALDGERELEIGEEDSAALVLRRNGPWLVDVERAMQAAAASAFFVD